MTRRKKLNDQIVLTFPSKELVKTDNIAEENAKTAEKETSTCLLGKPILPESEKPAISRKSSAAQLTKASWKLEIKRSLQVVEKTKSVSSKEGKTVYFY